MSASDSPLWRRAFDRAEHVVGQPLEAGANSAAFFTGLIFAGRLRSAVTRRTDALMSLALHQARLPSTSDIRDLQRQLGAVQREVGALRRELSSGDSARSQAAREAQR